MGSSPTEGSHWEYHRLVIRSLRHRRLLAVVVLVVLFLLFFAVLPTLSVIFHLLIGVAIIWVLFSIFRHR